MLSRHRSGISQSIRVGLTCCVSWCSREKNGAPWTSENHKAKAPRLLQKSANNVQSQTKSNQVSAHMILSIEKTELLEPKYNKYLNSGFSILALCHMWCTARTADGNISTQNIYTCCLLKFNFIYEMTARYHRCL